MEIRRPEPNQPRPSDAKEVFKGEIFSVYQWPQKLFDGTEATWEVVKRSDTVVVIPITSDGKIIILEQEQPGRPPYLSFPGGRVEEGENVAETAKRELQEETGYEPAELSLIKAYQPLTKIDWAIYSFIAKGCVKKHSQNLDAGEKITIKEITADECVALVSAGKLRSDEISAVELKTLLSSR